MPERRRTGLWVTGALAFTAAGAGLFLVSSAGRRSRPATPDQAASASAVVDDVASQEALEAGLRVGDVKALVVLQQRVAAVGDGPRKPLSEAEGENWLKNLAALRAGFPTYDPMSRATVAVIAAAALDQFGVEPAPRQWLEALSPIHDVFTACLADSDGIVRKLTLDEVRRFWVWMPGRSLTPAEEEALGAWKEGLHGPVVRCLASGDRDTKIAAVNTLGYLPVDLAAAPAVAYLEDPSADVRRQVLISFAGRPNVLTVDMLLKRLHDDDESIRDASKATLKVRGLNEELISLGGLMTSPKAEQRASVVALVKDRTDVDPIVWLLQLSRDTDESVRLHVVEALAAHKPQTVAIKQRLIEMARADASPRVSEAAGKLLSSPEETTAALPPLPGSSLLNPKAN